MQEHLEALAHQAGPVSGGATHPSRSVSGAPRPLKFRRMKRNLRLR
jgi:hypothetical protein